LGRWVIDSLWDDHILDFIPTGLPQHAYQRIGEFKTLAQAKTAATKANRLLSRTQGSVWHKATRNYAGKARRW
jgi:hypothetical protein